MSHTLEGGRDGGMECVIFCGWCLNGRRDGICPRLWKISGLYMDGMCPSLWKGLEGWGDEMCLRLCRSPVGWGMECVLSSGRSR